MRVFWLALLCLALAGCGSGSGSKSSGTDGNVLVPDPVTRTAKITVSTQGPSADTVLYAAQFTLRLPAGVTLPTNPGDNMLPAGVLQSVPSGSFAGGSYLVPAGADSGPTILVNISHPTGFTVGPLATLTCSIAAGVTPSAGGFSLYAFSARDVNGIEIPAITPLLGVQTQ